MVRGDWVGDLDLILEFMCLGSKVNFGVRFFELGYVLGISDWVKIMKWYFNISVLVWGIRD